MAVIDEHDRLNEILSRETPAGLGDTKSRRIEAQATLPSAPQEMKTTDYAQWGVGPNGMFRATGKTVDTLPVGAYMVEEDQYGVFLHQKALLTDQIIDLPDSANERVLANIVKFWESAELYRKHGLLFKRGMLMYGPPGSGKTITIHLIARDVIHRGGVVFFCDNPVLLSRAMDQFRAVEPNRPLVVVFEDIDEIISRHGEHMVLGILDGEFQTQNVVNVATTNYPERLGARIVNRPSRFDDRILVDMPSLAARVAYLSNVVSDLTKEQIQKWAFDAKDLSIAHLRELVASVACLGADYEVTLKRLHSMRDQPKDKDGMRERSPGFLY